jgi:hypothetical protein
MPDQDRVALVAKLKEELATLDVQFCTEARQRGFDPAQVENMALPTALAVLFEEREEIQSQLAEIEAQIKREKD